MEKKRCSRCENTFPLADFRFDNIAKGIRKAHCRDCTNARQREDRAKHGDKRRAADRAHYRRSPEREYVRRIMRTYGVALAQAEIYARKHDCDLCGRDNGGKRLALDHCHATGKVRGLLCDNCNVGLGKFRDDPHTLNLARKYVLKGGFGGYEPLTPEEIATLG